MIVEPVDTVFGKRIHVLFFIEHATRAVQVMGVTTSPAGTWVAQQARKLVMDLGERAEHVRFLIRDRDAKYMSVFDEVFISLGVRILAEYGRHYKQHRPHRARDRRPPQPTSTLAPTDLDKARLRREEVLGGLINEYRRAAFERRAVTAGPRAAH